MSERIDGSATHRAYSERVIPRATCSSRESSPPCQRATAASISSAEQSPRKHRAMKVSAYIEPPAFARRFHQSSSAGIQRAKMPAQRVKNLDFTVLAVPSEKPLPILRPPNPSLCHHFPHRKPVQITRRRQRLSAHWRPLCPTQRSRASFFEEQFPQWPTSQFAECPWTLEDLFQCHDNLPSPPALAGRIGLVIARHWGHATGDRQKNEEKIGKVQGWILLPRRALPATQPSERRTADWRIMNRRISK